WVPHRPAANNEGMHRAVARARTITSRCSSPPIEARSPPMSDRRRRAERALRRAVFGAMMGRLRTGTVTPAAVELSTVRKVLLIRLNTRLGNLLLVTPALAAVRRALPGAQVDLLCLDHYADLLAGNPDIDRTITLRLRWRLPLVTVLRLVRRLRHERYDLVIHCG